jgi:hypothetical protein
VEEIPANHILLEFILCKSYSKQFATNAPGPGGSVKIYLNNVTEVNCSHTTTFS